MGNFIILDNGDGTVGIIIPAQCGLTDQQIAEKDGGGLPYEIVDESQVPQDRTFRNAWQITSGGAEVGMPKARIIQMDRIRDKRSTKWADLDQNYMLCDEQDDAAGKSAIAVQKQVLRDLPTTFDLESITDPDILKETWPEEVL